MKFRIISFHSAEYNNLDAITGKPREEYAQKHGYELTDFEVLPTELGYGFSRIQLICVFLKPANNDWLAWMGADTLITNPDIRLETITAMAYQNEDLILTTDAHDINNDVMLIHRTDQSHLFFSLVLASWKYYKNHPHTEQQAMSDLLPFFPGFFKLVPQRILNAYDYTSLSHLPEYAAAKDKLGNYGQWQPGDFLIHFPGIELDKRVELAKKYANSHG